MRTNSKLSSGIDGQSVDCALVVPQPRHATATTEIRNFMLDAIEKKACNVQKNEEAALGTRIVCGRLGDGLSSGGNVSEHECWLAARLVPFDYAHQTTTVVQKNPDRTVRPNKTTSALGTE